MAPSHSLFARYAIVSFLISQVSTTCFFPDGSSDSAHSPCTSDSTSFCCDEGFECLSNGLCNDARYDNFERVLRGGCTDKDWGSGCPSRCTSVWPQGDEAVFVCGSGKACCGRTDSCCSDSSVEKWNFGSPAVIATAGSSKADATAVKEEDAKTTSTTAQQQKQTTQQTQKQTQTQKQETTSKKEEQQDTSTSTKADRTTSTSKPTATSSSKGDSSASSASKTTKDETKSSIISTDSSATSAELAVTQSRDTTSTGTGPQSTQNITNNYISSGPNNTVPIAIGVGVGVGVLLFLILLGACWYLRRKKRRQQQQPGLRSRDIATEYFEIEGSLPPEMGGKKHPYGKGSGVLFEMEGSRVAELPEKVEPKEVDGRGIAERKDGKLPVELKKWVMKQ